MDNSPVTLTPKGCELLYEARDWLRFLMGSSMRITTHKQMQTFLAFFMLEYSKEENACGIREFIGYHAPSAPFDFEDQPESLDSALAFVFFGTGSYEALAATHDLFYPSHWGKAFPEVAARAIGEMPSQYTPQTAINVLEAFLQRYRPGLNSTRHESPALLVNVMQGAESTGRQSARPEA